MARRLSQSDMDRIAKFVNTPAHQRTPDMLVPGEESAEGASE